ncbi:MAG: Ca2+-binding RTX toxin-like protein, partial [Mariniblastus sp.]
QFFNSEGDLPQSRWFSVQPGDLSDVRYRGAVNGGESESIGMMVWDGYSWSELVEFPMATTSEPIVLGTSETILVDQRRSAVAFFNTVDGDGDQVFSYNVVDYRINSDGGYWEFKGDRMPSASFFTVLATDLHQLFYVGGSTGPQSERVGIQVFDGFQFSKITNFEIRTVTPPEISGRTTEVQSGHYINLATGQTKNVIDGELSETGTPILNFVDADGDQVDEFLFNDLSANSNGGHFVFQGVRVQSASFFRVAAEDLGDLFYRGGEFGPQQENIRVLASSNGVWSEQATFEAKTLQNQFAPDLRLFNVAARLGVVMDLAGMFSWSDQDGDAIHSFSIYDTGDNPTSGFFSVNGVTQPAKTWLTLAWDQVDNVRYHLSNFGSEESIRMSVFDGRKVSQIQSAIMTAVAAPVIDATVNDIALGTIERVPASSLITQLDAGPSFIQYQVYDENDFFRSGRLELDGNDLQQGVGHTLSGAEFDRLVFKGAETDFGRQLDPMLVRGDNGITGWTEWERVNVNTDPVGADALTSGAVWRSAPGPKTVVTYMFIDGNSNPEPDYYRCAPLDEPDEECNVAGEAFGLSQQQREAIRETLGYYETIADLNFVEVAYTSGARDATMIFGASDLNPGGVAAWAYLPSGTVESGFGSKPGDVWFDTDFYHPNDPANPTQGTDVGLGSSFRFTAYHEIGHAIGFQHPFDSTPTLSIFTDFDYNTVMSYTHDSVNNRFDAYAENPSTAALWDVVEAQRLYGANEEFNANNNHYGNNFSGSYPYFVDNNEQHQTTLWDAGGVDTLNFTNHVADETIDLREGTWTSVNGVPQTTRIAYGTIIENARGGSGTDNIRGNETRNLLFGNGGDDTLRGGGDNDVLRGGSGNDTYIWSLGDGRDNVREEGNGGIDVIEFYDPSGSIDSLEDDFTVRRFGSELRIDLTLDQGEGQGTVTVINFEDPNSSVELLRIHGLLGTQVGNDVDLLSLYDIATNVATRYTVTDVMGQNNGYIAAPV